MNEKELVAGCCNNDRLRQRQLYDAYAGRMKVVCLRYVKDRDEAEDVLQDAFVKVFEKIRTFRGDCPLEAWIRRIVVNTSLNHLRDNRHFRFTEGVEVIENEADGAVSVLAKLGWQELLEYINRLPVGCRAVFNLYAIEGYQHNEISGLLGISEGTSKSQYSRARALLREALSQTQT